MHSSTAVVCRAIVMLGCLVVIPLVAVFGFSLPDFVTALVEHGVGSDRVAATDALDEAPKFAPAGELAGTNAPSQPGPASDPRVSPPNDRRGGPWDGNADGVANPNPAAASTVPFKSTSPSPAGAVAAGYDSAIAASSGTTTSTSSAMGPTSSPWRGLEPIPPPAKSPTTPGDGFVAIQSRLRGLGASYYRLESWGTEQQLFRFQCDMALGGNTGLTQHFEATDNDPLQAMGKVLAEVEASKARH